MRTDSADVRPNARLISIKCRIRAVSARVARGERSRARSGARNLWKFCKWPIRRTSAGAASAARYSTARGHPSPYPPLMGQKNFSEEKTPGKKSGREISPAAGGAVLLPPSIPQIGTFLRILPLLRLGLRDLRDPRCAGQIDAETFGIAVNSMKASPSQL